MILLKDDSGGLLSIGQVRLKSYLPSKKSTSPGLLGGTFFRALRSCSKKRNAKLEKATLDLPVASVIYILSSLSLS